MGNKSQKQTNAQLASQLNQQNQFAGAMGDRSTNEYNYRTGQRGAITDALWNQYNSAPELTGGSAGRAAYYDPAADFYRGMMDNGGFSDADKANYRSWTTAPIAGFYEGLKRNLSRQNAASGGFVGYNSQSAKMGRDAARQGALTAQESESNLLDMINKNKFQGAAGLNASYHPAVAGSAGSRGGAGSKDYYLDRLTGLMGGAEDLPYSQLAGNEYNAGVNTIHDRVDETPTWQKMVGSILPAAAGAAMSAFGGGGAKKPSGGSSVLGFF